MAGTYTVVSGNELLAACDGACEEDVSGELRVIPEIVVSRVYETTGRIPETGISQANMVVTGEVKGGPGVATSEHLFIGTQKEGGVVEGEASIQARSMILRGRLIGTSEKHTASVEVEELCVVQEVRNRSISARRILIEEDSHFSRLDAEQEIQVDGSVRGGLILCRNYMQVCGDLGTEAGGSHTQVVLPAAFNEQHKKEKSH